MAVIKRHFYKEVTMMVVASFSVHKFFTAFFSLSLVPFCKLLRMAEVCVHFMEADDCEKK